MKKKLKQNEIEVCQTCDGSGVLPIPYLGLANGNPPHFNGADESERQTREGV